MVQYSDLPPELGSLFGNSLIPPETRQVITSGWDKMKPSDQQALLNKVRRERDPFKRILLAVMEATNVSLRQPSTDESTA